MTRAELADRIEGQWYESVPTPIGDAAIVRNSLERLIELMREAMNS